MPNEALTSIRLEYTRQSFSTMHQKAGSDPPIEIIAQEVRKTLNYFSNYALNL